MSTQALEHLLLFKYPLMKPFTELFRHSSFVTIVNNLILMGAVAEGVVRLRCIRCSNSCSIENVGYHLKRASYAHRWYIAFTSNRILVSVVKNTYHLTYYLLVVNCFF